MNKEEPYILFLKKHHKFFYYIIPILIIIVISFISNFFYIDKKVVNTNRGYLLDMSGRSYGTFLYELNLPSTVGAVFIAGTPDNLEKTEKFYMKVNTGDVFTSQLRSFLYGKKITEFSIAAFINFMFGIFAILFSILAAYLVFKNGYITILIFLLLVIFKDYNQGLIYGLPLRHAYAVFNPLIAFCSIIFISIFLKNYSRKYWFLFVILGFVIAYIAHIRTSEGQIIILSLMLFTFLQFLTDLRIRKKEFKRAVLGISILLVAIFVGYLGYQKMVAAFEHHRDKKFNFPPAEADVLSSQPAYHSLYISLFRYEIPNKFHDKTGYDAVYERYPEIKKKFLNDINYVELANSNEYNKAIKELYFNFIYNNPGHFLNYLVKSFYDYLLFLPYFSWTRDKSAHAYLPKINENIAIEPQDLAPGFKDTPFNWLVNLKLKYLPESIFFWLYFMVAYSLLAEAIYTSFFKFRKIGVKAISDMEGVESNFHIYILRGMLIYFFFASVVRILIPVHGQGAVVAFNIIIIFNLVRIMASIGTISTKEINIPEIRMQGWLLLFAILFTPFLIVKSLNISQVFERNRSISTTFDGSVHGWMAYLANLSSVDGGRDGKCLQITTSENATGYAYLAFPTKLDNMYEITAYFKKGSSPNGQVKVGTSIDKPDLYYSGIIYNSEWTKYSGVFKATTPVTYVTLVVLTSEKNQTVFFDSVTVDRLENNSKQDNIKR